MKTRSHRRVVVAATALALALSGPLAAAAAVDPGLPQLDQVDAAAPKAGGHFRLDESSASALRSPQARASVAAAAPSAVDAATVTEVTSTRARATWSAPADNGSAIIGYHLQLLIGGNVIDEIVTDVPILGVTLTDLAPDTTYGFQVAAVNAVGTGPFSPAQSFTTTHSSVERQFGADRFETAVRVSESAFPYEGVPVTFIANGMNFPDALAAAAAAGTFGGPVLLTRPGSVSTSTVDEVAALKPEFLIAAGGKAVVSDAVLNTLRPSATVGTERAAGASRYETAGIISTLWEATGTVYLANGMNFPDALAGAAAAGHERAPVLLTKQNTLPAETAAYLRYLRPSKLVVLGGTGAVSQTVVDRAQAATQGSIVSVQRLFGDSRYDTAVDISRRTFTTPRVPVVYVASGQSFADALAGAAAAGALGGPVLLTAPTEISDVTIAEIKRLDPVRVVVLGGPAVVSDAVQNRIANAID